MTTPEDIRKQVEERVAQEGVIPSASDDKPEITSEFIRSCLDANELGDGTLYAAEFRDSFLFCKNSQEWFEWSGHHWQRDIMNHSLAAVEKVVGHYLAEYERFSSWIAKRIASGDEIGADEMKKLRGKQGAYLSRIKALRSDKRRTACLKFAHTIENPLAISGDEFDQKPMLFPCANGVIDLETGLLRPGNPRDYLFFSSPVPFLGIDTPAPIWERSLLEIFNGKEELVAYLRRLFGYCMTGLVTEKVLPFFYGSTGWNGRTLIVEAINHIMGTMSGSIPSEMLLSQKIGKSASGPSPEIMTLRGLRLACASEIDDGQRFSTAMIKKLTGRDELPGRNPHDKYITRFMQTHKLLIESNSKPSAPANDRSFWERLHLIIFSLSFVNREPRDVHERRAIMNLDKQIVPEYPGILAWMLRGCLEWQKEGLNPPADVLNATEEYRKDEDLLGDFREECCTREPGASEKASVLYGRFVDWYHDNIGKKEKSGTWFGKQMVKDGFEKTKVNGCVTYHGIMLNSR